jgi:predicted transcriptional regulator
MSKLESSASIFLELASEQRLGILHCLYSNPLRVHEISKRLDSTPQEVHRNIDRLSNFGLISKNNDNHFQITGIGRIMLEQVPLASFIHDNKKFLLKHNFDLLPLKFSRRLGVLEKCSLVKGVTNVLDVWKKIYENSHKYICDVLIESPSGMDEVIIRQIKKGVKYRHIINGEIIEHEGRTKNLKKNGYYDLIEKGKIARKEMIFSKLFLVLNEKEAGICFPSNDGEPDLRNMLYSDSKIFQDWCLDFFDHLWNKSVIIKRTNTR